MSRPPMTRKMGPDLASDKGGVWRFVRRAARVPWIPYPAGDDAGRMRGKGGQMDAIVHIGSAPRAES
jgi:hypothetical protein